MAPVVLQAAVYDYDGMNMIRNAIKNLYGVQDVWVSPDTGEVVVHGTADAGTLRWRIQEMTGMHVAVLSDGGATDDYRRHYHGMMQLGTPAAARRRRHYYYYSDGDDDDDDYPASRCYASAAPPPGYRRRLYGQGYGYGYGSNYRYLTAGEPTVFADDEYEVRNRYYDDEPCCSIQ